MTENKIVIDAGQYHSELPCTLVGLELARRFLDLVGDLLTKESIEGENKRQENGSER